jgi:hypothetical protein
MIEAAAAVRWRELTERARERTVVQGVADDGILGAGDLLKDPGICIEARGVENRRLFAVKGSDGVFELCVDILGPADEANTAQAKASLVDGSLGGGHHTGMARKTQIVIGASIKSKTCQEGETYRSLKLSSLRRS